MTRQFYLQDSRPHAYVGDGLSFWAKDGKGYVTDLAKAQLYTIEQATGYRDTDIPWPMEYVDARARVGVDCQLVTLSEAVEQYPDADHFYIQKPQTWNGNNLIWMSEGGGFTSDLIKAVQLPRSSLAAWIAKASSTGAVVWPCAYIDAHSRRLVERDDVDLKQALHGTGIKLPKPKRPRMMMFNCTGCGRFVSDRQRFQHDCRNCGQDNRP